MRKKRIAALIMCAAMVVQGMTPVYAVENVSATNGKTVVVDYVEGGGGECGYK